MPYSDDTNKSHQFNSNNLKYYLDTTKGTQQKLGTLITYRFSKEKLL